jgi:hypothetical protein
MTNRITNAPSVPTRRSTEQNSKRELIYHDYGPESDSRSALETLLDELTASLFVWRMARGMCYDNADPVQLQSAQHRRSMALYNIDELIAQFAGRA